MCYNGTVKLQEKYPFRVAFPPELTHCCFGSYSFVRVYRVRCALRAASRRLIKRRGFPKYIWCIRKGECCTYTYSYSHSHRQYSIV